MGIMDSLAKANAAPSELALEAAPEAGLSQLEYFAKTADVLGSCNMLPRHIKTKGDCVAIMMAGAELGLPPMKAIRGIMMIDGKLELSADVMLALVKQHGYKVRWPETTDRVATLVLIDPRDPDYAHTQSFSMEEAAKAGLATKDNWRKYPAAMLRARVISASVRAFCPEVLAGSYHEGEIGGQPAFSDEPPVMSIRDDVETRAAISLAEVNVQTAQNAGDQPAIDRAKAKFEEAVEDRADAQNLAMQSEEQLRELELVQRWEHALSGFVLTEGALQEWIMENGGAYRLCVFHKERARVAIKNCVLAINQAEERVKGKDWITLTAIKESIDAAPDCEPDEEDETDTDFGP